MLVGSRGHVIRRGTGEIRGDLLCELAEQRAVIGGHRLRTRTRAGPTETPEPVARRPRSRAILHRPRGYQLDLGGPGVEPLDAVFDGPYLHAALKRRRVAVKLALLGGDIVVGAGNIYACEALFTAGIDPRTRSDRLSGPRCQRLALAIRRTLETALALGGSTLRDFRDAHGMAGQFQLSADVYGRAGEPCRVCATMVRRIVQGQRSTFFCPTCQKR